jgi:hypothetical protein
MGIRTTTNQVKLKVNNCEQLRTTANNCEQCRTKGKNKEEGQRMIG